MMICFTFKLPKTLGNNRRSIKFSPNQDWPSGSGDVTFSPGTGWLPPHLQGGECHPEGPPASVVTVLSNCLLHLGARHSAPGQGSRPAGTDHTGRAERLRPFQGDFSEATEPGVSPAPGRLCRARASGERGLCPPRTDVTGTHSDPPQGCRSRGDRAGGAQGLRALGHYGSDLGPCSLLTPGGGVDGQDRGH